MSKTAEEILKELEAPFMVKIGNKEYPALKWKPQAKAGQRVLCVPFLDRTLVSKRLDDVLGLDGWNFEHELQHDKSVKGEMSIKIGDKWITRTDVGTQSNTEKEKGAVSDSLKRCASLFGVGRYVYDIPIFSIKGINGKPCDHKGKPLYGDALGKYINGIGLGRFALSQIAIEHPELQKSQEFINLWNHLKTV